MGLNWKSVKAVHVTQACERLLNSAGPGPRPPGLIVTYKNEELPAKVILRIDQIAKNRSLEGGIECNPCPSAVPEKFRIRGTCGRGRSHIHRGSGGPMHAMILRT